MLVTSALFFIIFFLAAAVIVFTIIRGIAQWSHNNSQPVLTVPARITGKRTHTSHHHSMNDIHHHHHSSTSYYVTFEVESGDRMEFRVPSHEYGLLAEGDFGKLTFQGTRYHGFKREIL